MFSRRGKTGFQTEARIGPIEGGALFFRYRDSPEKRDIP
jgi:hypothetical protein